eukprot:SAG11_NODE_2482_length_3305_cov_1.521210_2_plen_175_part_00
MSPEPVAPAAARHGRAMQRTAHRGNSTDETYHILTEILGVITVAAGGASQRALRATFDRPWRSAQQQCLEPLVKARYLLIFEPGNRQQCHGYGPATFFVPRWAQTTQNPHTGGKAATQGERVQHDCHDESRCRAVCDGDETTMRWWRAIVRFGASDRGGDVEGHGTVARPLRHE